MTDAEETEFVRGLLCNRISSALRYEEYLRCAHLKMAAIVCLLARSPMAIDPNDIDADDEANIDAPETADELIEALVASTKSDINMYERMLVESHVALAAVKAVIARGGYQIDFDAAMAEQRKKLDGNGESA